MQANEEANSQLWGSAQTLYNCYFGIIVDRRNSGLPKIFRIWRGIQE